MLLCSSYTKGFGCSNNCWYRPFLAQDSNCQVYAIDCRATYCYHSSIQLHKFYYCCCYYIRCGALFIKLQLPFQTTFYWIGLLEAAQLWKVIKESVFDGGKEKVFGTVRGEKFVCRLRINMLCRKKATVHPTWLSRHKNVYIILAGGPVASLFKPVSSTHIKVVRR